MNAFRIKDWDQVFENNESRKLLNLRWVPMPNSWESLGYVRVTKHKNAVSLLAAWPLVVQIASKCPQRGLLANVNAPLTVEDMADLTRMPAQVFERALEVLSDPLIGWIELVEIHRDEEGKWKVAGDPPAAPPDNKGTPPGVPGSSGPEGNGKEPNGSRGNGAAASSIPWELLGIPGFAAEWEEYRRHRCNKRAPMTDHAESLFLATLAERPHLAVAALQEAIISNWTGFKWDWLENRCPRLFHAGGKASAGKSAALAQRVAVHGDAYGQWLEKNYDPGLVEKLRDPATARKDILREFLRVKGEKV